MLLYAPFLQRYTLLSQGNTCSTGVFPFLANVLLSHKWSGPPHSASIHTAMQDLSHTASVRLLLARGFYSGDQRTCVAADEGLKMWPMKAEYTEIKPSLHDYTDK